eukprot:CAMPEP_0177259512 /NCGR_PEP_ID=MMETSP0367-20130122/58689_1 /TAXON_ID=447022 ORGANISM="Scrippsiella hangoei-like, Strain SHHI-4" /NCGR_SAMPLE_ID=MMETSP0367 /ASSEMBLY_ACC=CAM_ASM_000362 /LENGTH=596 /DNA_ID=CAMNT_0018713817 /DNA_START=11 /DNA_END=1797 /DNA_ORIENTATION=-
MNNPLVVAAASAGESPTPDANVAPFASWVDLEAEASRFFLADTSLRLGRLIEQTIAMWVFTTLLYFRLLSPGGHAVWSWFDLDGDWALVFVPLFLMDWRNYVFWKYLHDNRRRFPGFDSSRYMLVCVAEALYKVSICIHLTFRATRSALTVKVAMFPYGIAYLLYFVIGHFVPMEDNDRPEGCNILASLLGDLGRFLGFVLLVSISMKIDGGEAQQGFTWQAAFWPCWGLEGIICLGIALLLPICIASVGINHGQVLLLSWVILFSALFGVTSFTSMYNAVIALDGKLCPNPPWESVEDLDKYASCRQRLQLTIAPWIALLPVFAISTLFLRRRLAAALHAAWYETSQVLGQSGMLPPAAQQIADLPAPELLFRVTATYYSRTFDSGEFNVGVPEDSLTQAHYSVVSDGRGGGAFGLHGGSLQSWGGSLMRTSRVIDPSTSILSARGTTFSDIVESEQLCFICYDQPPQVVLMECGHAGLCEGCAIHLSERRPTQAQCPICRSGISCVMRLRTDLTVPSHHFVAAASSRRPGASVTPAAAPWAAAGATDEEQPSLLGASASEVGAPVEGPPWPAAAKAKACVVEAVRRQQSGGHVR